MSAGKFGAEDYFRLIVEHSPTAVVMVDGDGRITLVNRQAERLFGYERGALLDQPLEILVPSRLRDGHRRERSQYIRSPAMRPMGVGRDLYGLRADGHEIPIEIGLNPIDTPQGRRIVASIIDIAERKQSEKALRKGEERFRLLVENAPNAMLMVDEDGLITLINRQTEALFGYSGDEMQGRPVTMLIPERFRAGHTQLLRGFMQAAAARPMGVGRDLYGLCKNGSEVPIEIGLNPVETPEGRRVLASIIDITERKHAQMLIEGALREKTALLNEVHHRVKNNLQVISSLLALQAGVCRSDEARKVLNDSRGRVQAMALTHQLLYERREFGRVHLGQYLARLAQLLLQSFGMPAGPVRMNLRGADAEVYVDIERAIPCGLIVNELVTNALKHAFPSGSGGEIAIGLELLQPGEARLSVVDDGIGLPAGVAPDSARTLGFQLIASLVEQIHARLNVASTGGTRFEICFPVGGTKT